MITLTNRRRPAIPYATPRSIVRGAISDIERLLTTTAVCVMFQTYAQ